MDSHKIFRLANDPLTSSDVLYELAKSDREEIRASVAANPSSNQKTLLALTGDTSTHVIENLMENSNRFQGDIKFATCKNIVLTLAEMNDAEFILSLRQSELLNRYVSQVSPDIDAQRKWLKTYKKREAIRAEFYFIIRDRNMSPLGTVRLYDFQRGSFCWGSWIVKPDAPMKTATESALSVYEFAFYTLGFKKAHFDVRNENEKVIKFHTRMGAEKCIIMS